MYLFQTITNQPKMFNCHINLKHNIMKTTKHFFTAIFLLLVTLSYGQDYAYVNADSGLTVRERPDIGASKLGKLMYNEAVEVVEKTDVKLVVVDDGNKVSGEWVKIKMNGYQDLKGYVFNGFLSETKIPKIVNIKLAEADIHIKNLAIYNDDELLDLTSKNDLTIVSAQPFTLDAISVTV